MIDEEKTFKLFGYHSYDLKPKSGKKIICICNKCGKERTLCKHNYSDTCKSCSKMGERHYNFGKHHSKVTREKISKACKGKCSGENHPMYGKHHSKDSLEKLSKARKGKCCGINNPRYIDGKSDERDNARRRGFPKPELFFGNKYNDTEKMIGHHFNEKTIIYIPEYMHRKIPHNLRTGKGMMKINMLALIFLLKGY